MARIILFEEAVRIKTIPEDAFKRELPLNHIVMSAVKSIDIQEKHKIGYMVGLLESEGHKVTGPFNYIPDIIMEELDENYDLLIAHPSLNQKNDFVSKMTKQIKNRKNIENMHPFFFVSGEFEKKMGTLYNQELGLYFNKTAGYFFSGEIWPCDETLKTIVNYLTDKERINECNF
jgi:hypothetical protein